MRWKSSSGTKVGWFDIIFADWYRHGEVFRQYAQHQRRSLSFCMLFFLGGKPGSSYLSGAGAIGNRLSGACITVVYKGCQGVSDGFLFYTKKHPRNKINAEIRQGKTPRVRFRGKGKVKQYGFERDRTETLHSG